MGQHCVVRPSPRNYFCKLAICFHAEGTLHELRYHTFFPQKTCLLSKLITKRILLKLRMRCLKMGSLAAPPWKRIITQKFEREYTIDGKAYFKKKLLREQSRSVTKVERSSPIAWFFRSLVVSKNFVGLPKLLQGQIWALWRGSYLLYHT